MSNVQTDPRYCDVCRFGVVGSCDEKCEQRSDWLAEGRAMIGRSVRHLGSPKYAGIVVDARVSDYAFDRCHTELTIRWNLGTGLPLAGLRTLAGIDSVQTIA